MYIRRIAVEELGERLGAAGAVLIEGPRACGKPETARQRAASEVLLDVDENPCHAMAIDPALVLAGDRPRLIDEWQIEPAIWNHVRREVDRSRSTGQFILIGSAVPTDDITRHTGGGRISRIRLRTMSFFEAGFSTGEVSLPDLMRCRFEGCSHQGTTLAELVAHLSRGGWPGDLNLSDQACLKARIDYLEAIRRVDIVRVDGVSRNPDNVARACCGRSRETWPRRSAGAPSTTELRDEQHQDLGEQRGACREQEP